MDIIKKLTKIKVLSLNIWNYHNFNERMPKIISLIKEYDPDIVLFQEIRDDKNKKQENQLFQLSSLLKFEYSYFLPVQNFKEMKKLTSDCIEGLGVCSKFPVKISEIILKKHPDDKYIRKILHCEIKLSNQKIQIYNVHFSPNNLFAQLHLEETMSLVQNKKTIILGDFNHGDKKLIGEIAKKNSFKSTSEYSYISYPNDNCSYDYILISNDLEFANFECVDQIVSDHKAIYSEIIL